MCSISWRQTRQCESEVISGKVRKKKKAQAYRLHSFYVLGTLGQTVITFGPAAACFSSLCLSLVMTSGSRSYQTIRKSTVFPYLAPRVSYSHLTPNTAGLSLPTNLLAGKTEREETCKNPIGGEQESVPQNYVFHHTKRSAFLVPSEDNH